MKRIKERLFGFGVFVLLAVLQQSCGSSGTSESVSDPATCLVGVDWVYPSADSPTGAWKFSSDGTFNSSTTMFGGMSSWGNWEHLGDGKISITYTRGTEDYLPEPQVIELSGCDQLKVGQTIYSKD
jgi:hypothetical protein